ncbi:dihydroxyacetone kinase Dak1 [Fusarium oxysporum]|nr:dihydroxyacetone kinase [Fusarium oxysporum f. sp. lycopersici MN25]KAJ4112258.1 dihydroxyacetone kinase Dak1 [Fusarium oxysporum]KAJ4270632.1 dihydroxyacetone kinase Dak1 [Fusarium oxysporum]
MSAKHFINDPIKLVNDALYGIAITNPAVALDAENKIIYRRPGPDMKGQVSVVSGGGAGHEPAFAAFVGGGLLSASISGTIFASPNSEQVRNALTSFVDHEEGILVIVMNYTGDILNFGVAVEQAKSAGLNVRMLVVADDVGVDRTKSGKVGRRGIAGTVLVQKIAGAIAAQGASLDKVYAAGRLAADNLVSIGASLEHVHVPGHAVDEPQHRLEIGEIEVGMGIHNEPGSGKQRADLPQLVELMIAQLLSQADPDRDFLKFEHSEVVLLVNNLGGVSVLEMSGITTEVVMQLERTFNIRPVRILSGTYMTSLNGLGFSISLLKMVDVDGYHMIDLIDYPCEATGWIAPVSTQTWKAKNTATRQRKKSSKDHLKATSLRLDPITARTALENALQRVIIAEPDVTMYDTVVGDGDCGIGLKRGAEAILDFISQKGFSGDAVIDVASLAHIVDKTMDGTSGALYSIFLHALVQALSSLPQGDLRPQGWAQALRESCDAMSKYTPARPGDRTLVDALYPFIDVLQQTGDVRQAAEAALVGAQSTKGMTASLGRTVYVGGSRYQEVPDPGAWGLCCFFLGLAGVDPEMKK